MKEKACTVSGKTAGSYLVPPLRLLSSVCVRNSLIDNVAVAAAAFLSPSSSSKSSSDSEEKLLLQAEQHMMGQNIHDDVPMTTVGFSRIQNPSVTRDVFILYVSDTIVMMIHDVRGEGSRHGAHAQLTVLLIL